MIMKTRYKRRLDAMKAAQARANRQGGQWFVWVWVALDDQYYTVEAQPSYGYGMFYGPIRRKETT